MRKLIHSDFELDLSNFKISDTENNSWFADTFFTKYSFPFEIDLVKDLDVAFDFISLYNTRPKTYFKCQYVHNDKIEDAVFEVTELGEKLSCTLEYGFEQLPSFDKKLSELSLETFDLPAGIDIYTHANSIITQSWPAVNYNFPAVHTDKIDNTQNDEWAFFQKTINNRQNGQFLQNIYNTTEEWSENYNIMQPLPYWLHILERGFSDAGYTLAGQILQDERIKKATLFGVVEYYNKYVRNVFNDIILDYVDGVNLTPRNSPATIFTVYTKDFYYQLSVPSGYYNISGYLKLYNIAGINTSIQLRINNTPIINQSIPSSNTGTFGQQTFSTDNFYLFNQSTNIIEVFGTEVFTSTNPPSNFSSVCDLSVNKIAEVSNGVIISSIQNENKIQLKKAVPDISFGDFIKVIKNWFNYDITVVNKTVYMDKIESNINHNSAIDMQQFEVKTPRRKFYQGHSFLLKFQDIDNKDYVFQPVFQNLTQILNSGYTTNEKTNTIEINALPLPLLNRNSLNSAYAFENNDAKVYLVPYDGLVNSKNVSQLNDNYLLPAVHLAYWINWFKFRLNTIGFLWSFKSWEVNILNLTNKTKIFAYNNYHIIKSIQRTEGQPELYNIEIETESLK